MVKAVFGSPIPKSIKELVPMNESLLEELFPHVAKKLCLLWGSQEFYSYVEDDLFHHTPTTDRPVREGFPLTVLIELDAVLRAHIDAFPGLKSETAEREKALHNPWRVF